MIKSLRWRLQLWHAAILSLAVVVFAAAFYHQLRRSTLGEIDLELLGSARMLEGTLRGMPPTAPPSMWERLPQQLPSRPRPPGRPPGASPPDRPGNPRDRIDRERNDRQNGDRDRPDRDGDDRENNEHYGDDRENNERYGNERDRSDLWPPPPHPLLGEASATYYAIFAPNGRLLRTNRPELELPWQPTRRPVEYRSTAGRRELMLHGPHRNLIIVGRDITQELDRLTAVLVQLVLIGGGVLLLGLVGGWWLVGKAIRPIQRISQTAGSISANNLAQRIDTSTMDAELQSLATTLNSMLGRLEASFQQQSQFTADASHELRTPIAVLLSHCELALNRPRSADDYRQSLTTCQKAGERMRALVDGLLTLARADAGSLELQRSSVDLQAVAAEAAAMLAPLAQEHQVEVVLVGGSAVCQADADRILQVLINLLHNAIIYNGRQGQVVVETVQQGDTAILRVRDDGPGISADALPHLFDRFYRVDAARSRAVGGSGLGLAICKSIIDAHAGALTVSCPPPAGCLFEIRLS